MGACFALCLPLFVSLGEQEGVAEKITKDGLNSTCLVKDCILAGEQVLHHLGIGDNQADRAWALFKDHDRVHCGVVAVDTHFWIDLVADP